MHNAPPPRSIHGDKGSDALLREVPADCLRSVEESWHIQGEASAIGFDWPDISGVLAKVREETAEVEEAWRDGDKLHAQRELGDLLFAVVNLARFVGIHPARALSEANTRFLERFALLREEVAKEGLEFESCTLEQLDTVWERVKRLLEKAR